MDEASDSTEAMGATSDEGLSPGRPSAEANDGNMSLAGLDPWEYLDSEFRHQLQIRFETKGVIEGRGKELELYVAVSVAAGVIAQAATCVWGCRGGQHLEERMLRRTVNYAVGCVSLALGGLYDEAIGLLRNLAELANLVQLFALDPSTFHLWNSLSEQERWTGFRPKKVRERLLEAGHETIIDATTYSVLCELGVHVSPWSAGASHTNDRRLYVGGHFSAAALRVILNELAFVLASLLPLAGMFLDAPRTRRTQLDGIARHIRSVTEDSLRITRYLHELGERTELGGEGPGHTRN